MDQLEGPPERFRDGDICIFAGRASARLVRIMQVRPETLHDPVLYDHEDIVGPGRGCCSARMLTLHHRSSHLGASSPGIDKRTGCVTVEGPKYLRLKEAERRANQLSDQLGELQTAHDDAVRERDTVLAENAQLRRKLERVGGRK